MRARDGFLGLVKVFEMDNLVVRCANHFTNVGHPVLKFNVSSPPNEHCGDRHPLRATNIIDGPNPLKARVARLIDVGNKFMVWNRHQGDAHIR